MSLTAHSFLPVAYEKERNDEEMTGCINKMYRIAQTSLTEEPDSVVVCPSLDTDGKEERLRWGFLFFCMEAAHPHGGMDCRPPSYFSAYEQKEAQIVSPNFIG